MGQEFNFCPRTYLTFQLGERDKRVFEPLRSVKLRPLLAEVQTYSRLTLPLPARCPPGPELSRALHAHTHYSQCCSMEHSHRKTVNIVVTDASLIL